MKVNNTWTRFRKQLNQTSGNMAGFRGNDAVRKIPLYEVHAHPFYIDYAHRMYENQTRITAPEWKLAMSHSVHGYVGMHKYYFLDSFKLNDIITSASQMKCNHHYFHYNFLAKQDIRDFDHIVELGGGCGDMAKFIRYMGYKNKYTIIDLPEVLPIQEYNLNGLDINLTTEPVKGGTGKVLFISTWGMSECPIEWRDKVISTVKPTNWLIAYQREFEGIDNEDYFSGLEGKRWDFPTLSWDGGSQYILK